MNKTSSLQTRLFWSFALITVLAALLPALLTRGTLYSDRLELAERQAMAQAHFLKAVLESEAIRNPERTEEALAPRLAEILQAARYLSLRVSLIASSGRVIYDSELDAAGLAELDNHADRPEIEGAALEGEGTSLRHGASLGLDAVYAAVRLDDGKFLRVAVPVDDIRRSYQSEASSLAAVIAAVSLLCLLISAAITRWLRRGISAMTEVVESIARQAGGVRLRLVPGREFLPLAEAVNGMAERISEFTRTTADQRAQLETILNSMHEGLLVLDGKGKIRSVNLTLQRMFPGIERALGRDVIDAIAVPALQRSVDELFRLEPHPEQQAPGGLENRIGREERPDGETGAEGIHFELPRGRFMVAHISRPLLENDSLGAVLVFYDATELMRLERVRRDFAANVSHELRTPLTAIAGYAETLMNLEDLPEAYRRFARIIHKHGTALGGVINDLLTLSRIENMEQAPPLSVVDLAGPLEEAMSMCAEQARARGVNFQVQLEPLRVKADPALLTQVFRNLLENACRYSPAGGSVSIGGRSQGGMAMFTVADHGPGIPQEELERIFERFYQVEKERNSSTAGIGLAICKHIIERHAGRIWAESPKGPGDGLPAASTAMLFTLPLADPGVEENTEER